MEIKYVPIGRWEVTCRSIAGFGYDIIWQGFARTQKEVIRKLINLGICPKFINSLDIYRCYNFTDDYAWRRQFI